MRCRLNEQIKAFVMESKARKLLSRIAAKLGEKGSQEDARAVFNEAILSLPEKLHKLKKHIKDDEDKYFKFYESSCQEMKSENKIKLPASLTKPLNSFVSKLMINRSNCKKVQEILDCALKNELKDDKTSTVVQKLCNIAVGSNSALISHAVANALYSYLDEKVESVLKSTVNAEDIVQLQENLLKVSLFFQNQLKVGSLHQIATQGLPNPNHIQAALFSLYIDLEVQVSKVSSRKPALTLLEFSSLVMGAKPELLLDALVQASQLPNSEAANVLEPVYKAVILDELWNKLNLSVDKYLQFMLVAKQAIHVVKNHQAGLAKQFKEAALRIGAPDGFYKSIIRRVRGEDLLDPTAITADSEPSAITQYLLNKADIETMEDLVDLCHSAVPEFYAPHPEISEKPTETASLSDDDNLGDQDRFTESLFFIDTKPMSVAVSETENSEILTSSPDDTDTTTSHIDHCDSTSPVKETQAEENTGSLESETSPSESSQEKESESHTDTAPKMKSKKRTPMKKRKCPLRTRSTPRKQAKIIQKEPDLQSIPEGELVEAECTRLETKLKTLSKKSRSDSESSTGSHGYGTRSKSRNT